LTTREEQITVSLRPLRGACSVHKDHSLVPAQAPCIIIFQKTEKPLALGISIIERVYVPIIALECLSGRTRFGAVVGVRVDRAFGCRIGRLHVGGPWCYAPRIERALNQRLATRKTIP